MSFDLRNPRTPWLAMGLASVAIHGALAAGMAIVEPPDREPKARVIPVSVVIKKDKPKPPPPKEKVEEKPEPLPEPVLEPVIQKKPPPPPKEKVKKPKVKKQKQAKKTPPKKPTRPQATPNPPKSDKPPPPLMGLNLEGATMAAPGTGIAVPNAAADGERYGAYGGTGDRKNRKNNATQGPPPEGNADRTVPVAGVNTMPVLTRDAKPKYPPELKREGIEGRVVLSIVVGSDGRVRKVKLVKRLHPLLDKAAIAAARKLRFKPAKANGKAVAVRIPYTFTFVIE